VGYRIWQSASRHATDSADPARNTGQIKSIPAKAKRSSETKAAVFAELLKRSLYSYSSKANAGRRSGK
jgi:hypothetical protein